MLLGGTVRGSWEGEGAGGRVEVHLEPAHQPERGAPLVPIDTLPVKLPEGSAAVPTAG